MDAMSLSLDDIIKKKAIGKRPKPAAAAVGKKAVTKVGETVPADGWARNRWVARTEGIGSQPRQRWGEKFDQEE